MNYSKNLTFKKTIRWGKVGEGSKMFVNERGGNSIILLYFFECVFNLINIVE